MPRPSSLRMTMALLDAHLTYDPKTGELRTKKMGKLLDPERLTKIGGVSIHPARAAYALGNLHIWDKVGFADGNPRNLKLDNLIRVNKQVYTKSGKPRKPRKPQTTPVVRESRALTRPTTGGTYSLTTMVNGQRTTRHSSDRLELLEWRKRAHLLTDQPPLDTAWRAWLDQFYRYDPDTGVLLNKNTGEPIPPLDRYGKIRMVQVPRSSMATTHSLRIDRLAWLMATTRLPDPETTCLARTGDLRATSVMWHPNGVPRALAPKISLSWRKDHWVAFVYHNRRTTRVPGQHLIEEEAEAAAAITAQEVLRTWESGLISLADFMAGSYTLPDALTPEEPEPELDDDLEPIVKAPAPRPSVPPTPQPTDPEPTDPEPTDTYVYPKDPDTYVWPEPEFNYVPPPRKPWVYVPSEITLEDLE